YLATTVIYSLSLHDALPIYYLFALGQTVGRAHQSLCDVYFFPAGKGQVMGCPLLYSGAVHRRRSRCPVRRAVSEQRNFPSRGSVDRKSTRLNSSHLGISYAV